MKSLDTIANRRGWQQQARCWRRCATTNRSSVLARTASTERPHHLKSYGLVKVARTATGLSTTLTPTKTVGAVSGS